MSDPIVVSVISALGVIIGGLITFFATRRLNQSSALKAITESTLQLIDPLNKRINELEVKTSSLQKENDRQKKITTRIRCALTRYAERNAYLLAGINILITQVLRHEPHPNFIPVEWIPPEVDEDE